MKNKIAGLQIFAALCVVMLLFSGCGIKGPPLPPEIKGQKIAAPFDLKCTRDGRQVALSWQHRVDEKTAAVKPDSFEVAMAQRALDGCAGCPLEFRIIGTVPMSSMQFMVTVNKGYKYYFRVRAAGDDNMQSPWGQSCKVVINN